MESEHRRGTPSARTHLQVASLALQRYANAQERELYDKMLYYGAFFVFVRSALQALEKSDAKHDELLMGIQKRIFEKKIEPSEIYKTLIDERHVVAHGDDSWAANPFVPLSMLDRFLEAGSAWDAAFDDVWPDDPFKGQPILDVLNAIRRQVSDWLDEVDSEHEKAWAQRQSLAG